MLKRTTIILLGFIAGVMGNLVAGYVQQDLWSNVFTQERLIVTAGSILLMLLLVASLETERALAWNWRWHRFWYLRELLKNPELRHWESDFARLEMVQGRRARISSAEVLAEGNRKDMIEVLRELIKDREGKISRALILGEPGSGKTTGLERLTLDLARAAKRRLGIGCKMPVLVRLGNFQEGRLVDHIAQTMRHSSKRSSGKILGTGIEMLLEQGHIVLLCDALDEALGARRDLVIAELKNLLTSQAYQNVPIIITSRTREDPGEALKGLAVFEIQDLNDEAVNAFIRAYKRSEHGEAEITQRLHAHRLLEPGGLGRNPFWLRLNVASGAFEGNKGQILNAAVDTLLAREWDEKPRVERSWQRVLPRDEQLEETKRGLAFLGYWMSAGNIVAIEQEGVLVAFEKGWLAIRQRAGVKGLRPQDVLGLGRDAQILVYEPSLVRFRHRLLQEFMTAWILMLDKGLLEQEIDRICEQVEWWETLFLLGGLLGTHRSLEAYSELVKRVMGDGTNDQRLFAAIGLVRSVENPPAESANSMMEVFTNSVGQGLTETQFSMAQEIGRILGDEASDIFAILFQSSNRDSKIRGAKLLLSIRSNRADKILLAALADEKESLLAIEVLASIGYEAIDLLIGALRDSGSLGQNAEKTLVRIGTSAVPRLITLLNDSDWQMRIRAANVLGEIGDERAIFPLKNYGYDARIEVASSVRSAWKRVEAALEKKRDPYGVGSLSAGLYSSSSVIRRNTAYALARIGDTLAIKALFNSFQNSVHRNRSFLDGILSGKFNYAEFSMIEIDALRKNGEPAVQFLLTVLHDNEENVNIAAAIALGLLGDALAVQRAVDKLVLVFSRYALDFSRCFSAERAIYAIGDSAVRFLVAALRDADLSACYYIERALARIGKPAVPLLHEACQDQDLSSRLLHVVNALKKIGEPAVEALITVLHGSNRWGCLLAVKALGDIGDPRGLPELERLARDAENGTLTVDAREAIEKIRQRMAESQKRME